LFCEQLYREGDCIGIGVLGFFFCGRIKLDERMGGEREFPRAIV